MTIKSKNKRNEVTAQSMIQLEFLPVELRYGSPIDREGMLKNISSQIKIKSNKAPERWSVGTDAFIALINPCYISAR